MQENKYVCYALKKVRSRKDVIMKKKILAILLCISVLLPCFAILAFADDASVEYDDYENTYNEFLS